jgi:hypothetical protein
MGVIRKSLDDIWYGDSQWTSITREQLRREGMPYFRSIWWNSEERLIAYLLPRATPKNPSYPGNFSLCKKTLDFIIRAQQLDSREGAARSYVGLIENLDSRHCFIHDTAMNLVETLADWPPMSGEGGDYWYLNDEMMPASIHLTQRRSSEHAPPPFLGRGLFF